MDERDDEPRAAARPTEGVRIIGAEEAQAAIDAGHVAGRRPDDAPRFGDRPPPPDGPRPPLRFPLAEEEDPTALPRPPLAEAPEPTTPSGGHDRLDTTFQVEAAAPADLPHWTEPPTGEMPRILPTDEGADDVDAWSTFAGQAAPRWRDQASDWADVDEDDPVLWAGDDEPRVGALDPDRPGPDDLFTFDEPVFSEVPEAPPEPEPVRTRTRPAPRAGRGARGGPAGGGGAGTPAGGGPRQGPGRDVGTAVMTGLAVAAILLGTLQWVGNSGGAVIATIVLTLASVELVNALWQRGFRPAKLLVWVGTAALTWAAYARGEQAIPLLAALFVVFALLWYLSGVETRQPTMNAAVSLLAFAYVGVLGSTAALILDWRPGFHDHGVGIFLGAVIGTVGYDVGGFFFGSQFGRAPLLPHISPNKTVEGLLGGMFSAITASVIITTQIAPWNFNKALALGVVVAIAAPLGDLCESMIKRDLDIKDMGTILPGHGGVLDRIDALLFVMPATYYLAKFLEIR